MLFESLDVCPNLDREKEGFDPLACLYFCLGWGICRDVDTTRSAIVAIACDNRQQTPWKEVALIESTHSTIKV